MSVLCASSRAIQASNKQNKGEQSQYIATGAPVRIHSSSEERIWDNRQSKDYVPLYTTDGPPAGCGICVRENPTDKNKPCALDGTTQNILARPSELHTLFSEPEPHVMQRLPKWTWLVRFVRSTRAHECQYRSKISAVTVATAIGFLYLLWYIVL